MKNRIVTEVGELLRTLREEKPLIHHITNYVTVNDCANIVLAIGASPVMADDINEVQEIASISSALVINIGTLNQRTVTSMLEAGKKANERNIPVVLDPVGVGASPFRNRTAEELLKEVKLSVLRGNMSEIRFIAGLEASTRGVDASGKDIMEGGVQSGIRAAKNLAQKLQCTVAITGATDIISGGGRIVTIDNGHKMLSCVTGTGCMATSLIGSFCGVTRDYFLAAVSGILSMGIAGEIAYETAGELGTGSFRSSVIDQISRLNAETIAKMARLSEI